MKIKSMYKIIGELESLGDSGEAISRILSRKNSHNRVFDAESIRNLNIMAQAVDKAYDVMIENLTAACDGKLENIINAYDAEENINNLRDDFRDTIIDGVDSGLKNYPTSVYYMDIMSEYERMGDFMINISQNLAKAFIKQ